MNYWPVNSKPIHILITLVIHKVSMMEPCVVARRFAIQVKCFASWVILSCEHRQCVRWKLSVGHKQKSQRWPYSDSLYGTISLTLRLDVHALRQAPWSTMSKSARIGLRGSSVKCNCHWQLVGRHSVSRFLAVEETNAQRQKLPPVPFISSHSLCPNTN